MKSIWFFILSFFISFPVFAEEFQGQVVHVDRLSGNVTVRYRDQAGRIAQERVFRVPNTQGLNTSRTLEDVEIGDEVQLTANNRNGLWEVQNFVTNPNRPGEAGVVAAGPGSAGTSFTASGTGTVPLNGVAGTSGTTTGTGIATGTRTTSSGMGTSAGTGLGTGSTTGGAMGTGGTSSAGSGSGAGASGGGNG